MIRLEAMINHMSINTWLLFSYSPSNITALILRDDFCSSWLKAVHQKLVLLGFSSDLLQIMVPDEAKPMIKQRVFGIKTLTLKSREILPKC